jgi:hypothetical protein
MSKVPRAQTKTRRPARRQLKEIQIRVVTNLPPVLPNLKEELAIWRAFLADEIDKILYDDEQPAKSHSS